MATFDPPEGHHRRAKAIIRYILHIFHILIALELLAIVIIDLIGRGRTLFILYLIPLIIITLVVEICHLCLRSPPERLKIQLGALNRLQGRAFAYQAAAALAIVHGGGGAYSGRPYWRYHDGLLDAVIILGWIVWSNGLALFTLAILAQEFDLLDWIDERTTKAIRLEDSDVEDNLVRSLDHPA